MSTYALENSSSTIAGNLCYANVAMWESLTVIATVSTIASFTATAILPVNPVSVVTPVAANTAFHLNCLSHCLLYWC